VPNILHHSTTKTESLHPDPDTKVGSESFLSYNPSFSAKPVNFHVFYLMKVLDPKHYHLNTTNAYGTGMSLNESSRSETLSSKHYQCIRYRYVFILFLIFGTLCGCLYIAGLTRWHKVAVAAIGRVRQLGLLLNGAGSKPAHNARLIHNKIIIKNGVSTIRGPYP
jgi:hypothetical protein